MSENPEINAPEPTSSYLVPKRGRGRPKKQKRPVGRPKKQKRPVGRPRKSDIEISEKPETNPAEQALNIPLQRRRGRPRKSDIRREMRRRGRPAKLLQKNSSPQKSNKVTTSTSTTKKLVTKKTSSEKRDLTCAVTTCSHRSTDPGKKRVFYLIPNDARRSIWMYVAGISSIKEKRIYICDIHFNKEDFLRSGSQKNLRHTAVPTLHLASQEQLQLNEDMFSNLTINPTEITIKLHETIKKLTNFTNKYNEKYTDFLLSFYLKHSSAYKVLEKPLGLPSPLELKRDMYNSPINFARLSSLINKKLITMDDQDKECFVTCIQISIEPKIFYSPKSDKFVGLSLLRNRLAESVSILIAHGVNSEWHIPLDMAFINIFTNRQYTKNWIDQTLKTYKTLHVNGFAWFPNYADYPDSVRVFAILDTFKADFRNQDCHIFYDLHFLLKLLYFNLKFINYFFGEFSAKLEDLKELYAIDSKRTYPLAPKLSANNVYLGTFDQLTYEHIIEVFSEDTVAALRTYTEAELIKAEGTAVFVENISLLIKLFDSNIKLTNEEKESIVYKVKEFFKMIKNDQINHFIDSLSTIMDIYIEDPNFFSKMSKYLLNNYIYKFVDNILNNSIGEKPTGMDVENAYRKSFVENLLKPMKKNVSFDEALDLAQKELSIDAFFLLNKNEHINQHFTPSDYKLYMLEREDRILYVAGYILKKCILHHDKCSILKDYMKNHTKSDKLLSKSIQKDIDEGNCSILKNDFVEFIEVLEIYFLSQFLKWATRDFLIKNLLKSSEMQAIKFTSACSCFPSSYARELFIRIRVDYVISSINMKDDAKSKVLQAISL